MKVLRGAFTLRSYLQEQTSVLLTKAPNSRQKQQLCWALAQKVTRWRGWQRGRVEHVSTILWSSREAWLVEVEPARQQLSNEVEAEGESRSAAGLEDREEEKNKNKIPLKQSF